MPHLGNMVTRHTQQNVLGSLPDTSPGINSIALQLQLFKHASLILLKPGHGLRFCHCWAGETFSDANLSQKDSKITNVEEKSKQFNSWMNCSFSQRRAVTGMSMFKGEAAKSWENDGNNSPLFRMSLFWRLSTDLNFGGSTACWDSDRKSKILFYWCMQVIFYLSAF